MTVQIDHGRVDIERMRQWMELETKRLDLGMKRLDEEIARAKKLYNLEIWKVIIAAGRCRCHTWRNRSPYSLSSRAGVRRVVPAKRER